MSFTQGSTRQPLTSDQVQAYTQSGALVLDSRRRRPLWFDGRFLAARDLAREQDYFLQRQADLGRTAGFGVVHGLQVVTSDNLTLTIKAGQGVTPGGELVLLPSDLDVVLSDLAEEQKLDVNFGLGMLPQQARRTRSGIYVLALRPVEFTANPITSYPTSIQGTRQTHDGDIVEATAVALVPYPNPVSAFEPADRQAALAWQIFSGTQRAQVQLNDSLLPLAIVSLERGTVEWVDQWLVRREAPSDYAGQQFGLTDRSTEMAFFQQYDAQLQQVLAARGANAGNFSASQYFRLLPPVGRFPLQSIDVRAFTQSYFPQHLDVRVSIIPTDELPALVNDGFDLPPLDLTLAPDDYTQLAVFALIPVPRANFAALQKKLTPQALQPAVPQIISFRRPIELLRLYRGDLTIQPTAVSGASDWGQAIGTNTLGFYVRRKSAPQFVDFSN
ncbi:MAG TPA: hypothetical protein VG871_06145 [Vicinamibacterales bacterium]|nr:hypothetical protein [Vicinamibacterales bacterium]